jgi:Tol biopolymer transport system component
MFPFDATRGRVTGSGQALTPPGVEAWQPTLTRDGKKLAFAATRAGRWELWVKSLVDGRASPVAADDYQRYTPTWSPDGTRLAYGRVKTIGTRERGLLIWSAESRQEEPLTAPSNQEVYVFDWSRDGKRLLVAQEEGQTHEVWLRSAAPTQNPDLARKLVSSPAYDLYQPHFSPDGRWIAFEAIRSQPTLIESTIFVTPAAGGPWIGITDGKHWDDKPRWAPDGKTLYFVSSRGGFLNVWGIRFDPARSKAMGDPFQVAFFESTDMMVPKLWVLLSFHSLRTNSC